MSRNMRWGVASAVALILTAGCYWALVRAAEPNPKAKTAPKGGAKQAAPKPPGKTKPAAEKPAPAAEESDEAEADQPATGKQAKTPSPFTEPEGAKRLAPKAEVWIDPKQKVVIVDGEVRLREGMLEMFACPKGTKEHESIVGVNSPAYYVHAALLAVGAKVGNTVKFNPKYVPASGTEVEILVQWFEEGKKQETRAQEWIRDVKKKKPLAYNWVFGGSGFWFDEETGREFYQADDGYLICVSNFPTATLDLPVASPQANVDLLYEPNTEKIPPLGTKVRLILKPKLDAKDGEKSESKPDETQPNDNAPDETQPDETPDSASPPEPDQPENE